MSISGKAKSRLDAVRSGYSGDEDAARNLLLSDDAGVRSSAVGSLGRMGKLSDSDLISALSDTDDSVRVRALHIAASSGTDADSGVVSTVLDLLDDSDAHVAETAAYCTGELLAGNDEPEAATRRDPQTVTSAVERLDAHARHAEDPLLRESAVAALGAIGDDRGFGAVLGACSDRPAIRRRAAIALVAFDRPEAAEALVELLGDRDWQVRMIAEDLS